MLDARHGRPQCCEAGLLLQKAVKVALHRSEFALDDADLVFTRAGADDARRVFRIGVKRDHRAGDVPHRPDHDKIHAREYQHGADQRDEEAGDDHSLGIVHQCDPDRRLPEHNADRFGSGDSCGRDDMQCPAAAIQHAVEAVAHAAKQCRLVQIDRLVDNVRNALDQK